MTNGGRTGESLATRRHVVGMVAALLSTLAGCGSSNGGSSSKATLTSTPTPEGPISYSPTNARVGEEITFDASEITEITWKDGFETRDGQVTKYQWDFDNDGAYEGRGISSSHIYDEPGQHIVSLKMIADCSGFSCGLGFQRDITETITVPVSVAGESGESEPAESTVNGDESSGIEIDNQQVNILMNSIRTHVQRDETAILQFSAANYIGNDPLNVQLILNTPNDWSVTGVGSVESGGGQYSSTYNITPGDSNSIRIRIAPQRPGRYEITGRVVYYFGEDVSSRQNREFVVPITVI